jgi:hypothetical protein
MTASTLRSSAWTRCASSRAILDSDLTGRSRILIFQLQGHVRISTSILRPSTFFPKTLFSLLLLCD